MGCSNKKMAQVKATSDTVPATPFPKFSSVNSLAAKYVTEEKWNKLCTLKTKTSGYTLAKVFIYCIFVFESYR